jgi:hypothetical protein
MTMEMFAGVIGSGVLAQGFGVLMWAARLEMRVRALEVKG